jgi:hypothetical protein
MLLHDQMDVLRQNAASVDDVMGFLHGSGKALGDGHRLNAGELDGRMLQLQFGGQPGLRIVPNMGDRSGGLDGRGAAEFE